MIELRRAQFGFADGLIAEEVADLWEDWMWAVDQVLDDEPLLETVYEQTASPQPYTGPAGHAGGSCVALAVAQAHSQLEL